MSKEKEEQLKLVVGSKKKKKKIQMGFPLVNPEQPFFDLWVKSSRLAGSPLAG